MAFFDTTWYLNSVGYSAVTAWATGAAIAAGTLRRQLATPAVGSERVFVCIVAGTTHATTEPTWVLTRGAKTTDNTVTWQECTGASAVNGDLTNTPTWTQAKAIGNPTLGAIIKRNNGASYWICSTAGSLGASEPAWSNNTAGTTQTDNTATWTCLGVVGNFTGGQAPHARLGNVFGTSWFAAGNTIYVGDNHAETQVGGMSLSPSTSILSKILCHNHSGSYPPSASDLTTGATVSTTGVGDITFGTLVGPIYIYGIAFSVSSGASAGFIRFGATTATCTYILENCSLMFGTTTANPLQFGFGNAGAWINVVLNNTKVKFLNVTQSILVANSQFTWLNTGPVLVSGSSVPTILFQATATSGNVNTVVLEALDLSQLTGSLFLNSNPAIGSFTIKDCKLNASATVTQPTNTGITVQLIRSASTAIAYTSNRYAYEGTETTETSITRVGGAVDPTGQAQSRKIVTTANVQWLRPFQAEPYAIWNAVTGATVTVTVYGTINSASLPLNDELFMEVEYLGSSSQPLGSIVTTTKATVLSAGTSVASDNSSWNGGGSDVGWSPFKLSVTVTPGMAGVIEARIRAAKASTTYYIDPQIVLT